MAIIEVTDYSEVLRFRRAMFRLRDVSFQLQGELHVGRVLWVRSTEKSEKSWVIEIDCVPKADLPPVFKSPTRRRYHRPVW